MDDRRARINEDLRGVLAGDLLLEPIERAPYFIDASIQEIDPLGVVVPRTAEDVVHVARYAAENRIALHPRGGGTGAAGGAIGSGLVVDFSRYLQRVVEILPERVIVQPGVVLDSLNARLAPLGRRVGPDPAGSASSTIGGLVNGDALGPRSLRLGSLGDHVERLRVVFANGETSVLGRELWPGFDEEPTDFKGLVVRKLGGLVRRNMDLLMRQPPSGLGYALAKAASGLSINLPRVVVGSSGTLALVTEITLRTVPIPAAQVGLLLPFARLAEAAASATEILDVSAAVCELFDWRLIRLAREADPTYREWIPEAAEAILVVVFEGDDPAEVSARANRLRERMIRLGRLVDAPTLTTRRPECDRLVRLKEVVEPLLMRLRGRAHPTALLGDVIVRPELLPEMIGRLQALMRDLDLNWTLDAHAALGRIHARPFLDLSDPDHVARLDPLMAGVYESALELGGSVEREAARGPIRTQYLRRALGDLYPVFREVKDAFDPLDILNPAMVLGEDLTTSTQWLRRFPPRVPLSDGLEPPSGSGEFKADASLAIDPGSGEMRAPGSSVFLPVLRWDEPGPIEAASCCSSCGVCRSRDPLLRMCPTARATRSESATPRAKANLIRQIAAGVVDPRLWGTDEFKAHADLCSHCGLCATECPSGLDVSSMMLEAKAAFVENHGLSPVDWWLSRVELWAGVASRLPILSNAIMNGRWTRWMLERLVGLSRFRALPRARRTPFTRRAARLGLTRPRPHEPGPRVAYFVDVYANHFDQELAEAVVNVLRRAGVNVYVPSGQRDCGMPALVAGDVDRARDLALANLRVLGNAVRDGYTVVCSEPTSAYMIRKGYLQLTDDLDAALVAANTLDIGDYLMGLAKRGQLPAAEQPIHARVGYHQPCHLRALGVGTPGLELLRRVPELDLEFIDRGCSGMAGTHGLHRDHFRTSLRAGSELLGRLRDDDIDLGATECSACRLQMEQGSTKRTLHPVKLLGLAYGLNPSLRHRLKEPKPRHVID